MYKETTAAFLGQAKLPKGEGYKSVYERLTKEILKAIYDDGYSTFLFGCHYGFEQIAAEIVLSQRKLISLSTPRQIKLIGVVPYEEQAAFWREHERELYYNTLARCDDVVLLKARYHENSVKDKNRYLMQNASRLICYCRAFVGENKVLENSKTQTINIF